DCLSGREGGHEAEWRIALACLQCYDEAMAVGLHRVIGNPCERTEVDFLSLDRLERFGMKRAADDYRGDCRKQRGSIGHNNLRVGLAVRQVANGISPYGGEAFYRAAAARRHRRLAATSAS